MKIKKITHTGYRVEVWCRKTTRAASRKHGKQFNKAIENSIRVAIFQAANEKVQEHIKSGKLDEGFGVTVDP